MVLLKRTITRQFYTYGSVLVVTIYVSLQTSESVGKGFLMATNIHLNSSSKDHTLEQTLQYAVNACVANPLTLHRTIIIMSRCSLVCLLQRLLVVFPTAFV
jgi:hypothetical protein